jgi:hypothetical protein
MTRVTRASIDPWRFSGRFRRWRSGIVAIAMLFSAFADTTNSAAETPDLRLLDPKLLYWISPPRAYFAGTQVGFSLDLGDNLDCARIHAILIQVSSKLEAKFGEPRGLNCVDGALAAAPDRAVSPFEFLVPEVRRKSKFEWRFGRCAADGSECEELLSVPFLAYPEDLLEPARHWAKNNVLVVEDRSGTLQDFLEQQGIEFFEGSAPSHAGAVRTTFMVEGERPFESRALARHMERGSVVLFREKLLGLPHVKSVLEGETRMVSVELPLLAALPGQPAAQEMFLEILRLSLE